MATVYKTGLVLPSVMCHRCGADRRGTVRQEMAAWRIHLECGHVKHAGWTKPVAQLREEKLVTTETPIDPRAASNKRSNEEEVEREFMERERFGQNQGRVF